jgi:hypothetical protein
MKLVYSLVVFAASTVFCSGASAGFISNEVAGPPPPCFSGGNGGNPPPANPPAKLPPMQVFGQGGIQYNQTPPPLPGLRPGETLDEKDPQNGLPTGQRMHRPIVFTLECSGSRTYQDANSTPLATKDHAEGQNGNAWGENSELGHEGGNSSGLQADFRPVKGFQSGGGVEFANQQAVHASCNSVNVGSAGVGAHQTVPAANNSSLNFASINASLNSGNQVKGRNGMPPGGLSNVTHIQTMKLATPNQNFIGATFGK